MTRQLMDAGVRKCSLLWVSGFLELEEYTRKDGVTQDKRLKLKLKDWELVSAAQRPGKASCPTKDIPGPEIINGDLDSRGRSSLTMNEDGSIRIQPAGGGEELARDAFPSFPEKVYWPRLVNVLNQEGLTADMQGTGILVSW